MLIPILGNFESLRDGPAKNKVSPRDELIKFHKANYSSNIMYLTLMAPRKPYGELS